MRKVILHIGTHKTGTSFIQKRLEASVGVLPKSHGIIVRKTPALEALTTTMRRLRSVEQARDSRDKIALQAQKLARECVKPNTLISHEDILGPVPTRANIRGLYPYLEHTLPAVLHGFQVEGIGVSVVIYTREFDDWLGSVFRYRFKDRPHGVFNPKRYRANNALPDNWDGLLERVQAAVGANPLHVFTFEGDRATGNLGGNLYTLFGLSDAVQARFAPMEAQNVTSYETSDPAWINEAG